VTRAPSFAQPFSGSASIERVERQAHSNTLSVHDDGFYGMLPLTVDATMSTHSESARYSSPYWPGNARRLNVRCSQR